MSSIKLSPNASGTGIFTIAAPNSNNNQTVNLPDQSGTLFMNSANGALNVDAAAPANSLVISSAGNVGINTSSPGSRLDVSGSLLQRDAYANLGGFNAGTTGNSPNIAGIAFSTNITNGQAEANIWNTQDPASYANTGILFTQRLTSTTRRDLMFLHNNGNVGIGTSSPNYSLTAYKAGATAAYLQVANGATGAGAANGLLLGVDTSGNGVINAQGVVNLNMTVAGVQRATITSDGNVGIGTSSPQARLGVAYNNNTRADLLRLTNSDTTGYGPWLNFYGAYNGGYSQAKIGSENDGVGGSLRFHTANSSSVSTEQARITAAGLFQFNSGYGSVATAYGCRAWVNFNGTGTVAIRASGNVSSITDNGTGDYTVNFTSAMPDTSYAATGFAGDSTANNFYVHGVAYATGSLRINVKVGGTAFDSAITCVTIFR